MSFLSKCIEHLLVNGRKSLFTGKYYEVHIVNDHSGIQPWFVVPIEIPFSVKAQAFYGSV